MTREVLATLLRWIVSSALVVACVACGADEPAPVPHNATGAEDAAADAEYSPRVLDEPHQLLVTESGPDGAPLPGAEVTVEYEDGSIATLHADANGKVELGRDVGRMVSVRAHAPGRVRVAWIPRGQPWSGWPPERLWLGRGVELSGRVIRSEDGLPIAGVEVSAFSRKRFWGGRSSPLAYEDRTLTDTEGRYTFPGVPMHPDPDPWGSQPLVVHALCAGYVDASRPPRIDSVAGTAEPLVLSLDPDSPIEGVVRDRDGRAIADVNVHVRPVRDSEAPEQRGPAVTDAEGRFVVRGVRAGASVTLSAAASEGARSAPMTVLTPTAEPVVLELRRPRSVRVRVTDAAGRELDRCSVRTFNGQGYETRTRADGSSPLVFGPLAPGRFGLAVTAPEMAPSFRWYDELPPPGETLNVTLTPGRTLEGTVVDDRGRPVRGAWVRAGPPELPRGAAERYVVRGAKSHADGRFTIEQVADGELVAVVTRSRHETVDLPVTEFSAPLRLRLQRLGSVEAAVVPAGGPVSGRECGVSLSEGPARTARAPWIDLSPAELTAEITGSSLVVSSLPPGRRTVRVVVDEFSPMLMEVDVRPGECVHVGDVALQPALALSGQVLDDRGRPVAGVRVRDVEYSFGIGDTDAEGRFRMAAFSPGAHRLFVNATGLFGWARANLAADRGVEPVVIRMERTRPVRLRVRDARGNGVHGGACRPTHVESSWGAWSELDHSGTTDLELVPGRYEVEVRDAAGTDFAPVTILVEPIPDGEDAGADITIQVR